MKTPLHVVCILAPLLWSVATCLADYQALVYDGVSGLASGVPGLGDSKTTISNTQAGATLNNDYTLQGIGVGYSDGEALNGSASTTMSVMAHAEPGILKVLCSGYATATSNDADPYDDHVANSGINLIALTASYSDDIVFAAPGYATGRSVTLNGSFGVIGSTAINILGADAYPSVHQAKASFALSLTGTGMGYLGAGTIAQASDSTNPNSEIDIPGLTEYPDSVTVQVGVPFTISYTLTLQGYASAQVTGGALDMLGTPVPPGSVSAFYDADYSDTVSWGGITSVVDDNGQPINDWSVTSTSGFNYAQAAEVPEPSGLAIATLATLACLAVRPTAPGRLIHL